MSLLLDVLTTVEFLAHGPPDLPSRFMALGRTRTLPRSHVLWRAGQSPETVVVPVTGELAALGRDSGGRGICYAFFGVGECVGVPAAVDGMPAPREIRVIRGGEFFVVDRASFLRFLDAHADVRARVTEFIGRIFRRGLDERDRDVFLPVHARVARFLLEHACVRRSDGARILMRESQPEIGIRLGSVREVVAREMSAFADQGLIRRTRHALFVVDWAGLLAKADCARDESGGCSCEAESAAVRTYRFFLPVLDGGAERVAEEERACGEHLVGFRACVARGCPLALAAAGGARSSPSAAGDPSRPERVVAARRRSASAPETHDAVRASAALRTDLDRVRDEPPSRTPQEAHEIRRRIELYRRRAAGIESRFGGESAVPERASVFGES
jgi:CRP-like cAMP-binding protein